MAPGRLPYAALAVAFLIIPAVAAQTPAMPPVPQSGPDVPAALPVAEIHVFANEVYSYTAGPRTRVIDVPSGWNRVVLTLESHPAGDPWDRTFGVAIGGAEVIHGTTPRTAFTIDKDVTEFASLLPQGETAPVTLLADSWVGALVYNVWLKFYQDPVGLVTTPDDFAKGAFLWQWLCANGARRTTTVEFPADAPLTGTIELTASGHGNEEFFWQVNPQRLRTFHVLVDGVELATIHPLPYTYAFLGFYEPTGSLVHGPMWWTAQRALDVAGVHTGVGEIPPYRVEVVAENLGLLTGTRTVELVMDGGTNGACAWITSVSFLTDEGPR